MTIDQLLEVVQAQKDATGRPRRFGTIARSLGYASEDQVARAVAQQLGIAFLDLRERPPSSYAGKLIPEGLARKYHLIGHSWAEDGVTIAMADPTEIVALDDLRTVFGRTKVEIAVAAENAIVEAIDRIYETDLSADELLNDDEKPSTEPEPKSATNGVHALGASSSTDVTATAPVVRAVNSLLSDAIRARATDVHIEPRGNCVKVRYRIDGILRDAAELPKSAQLYITSRVKVMGSMDIAERRQPQDGRTALTINHQAVDARISTLPTYWGEKIVVRLLPVNPKAAPIEDLGMDEEQLTQLRDALANPQGLIVFTGPTGAGKTSTMYASLSHIMSPDHNMVTLEDPIESQLEGLNQVQIEERAGITFASGLRSILRQDPDVIMVGEIRDSETASTVIQASLSGHLVLSSLHTNDAAAAVTRLLDLGVEHFLIASGLTLVVAQRLVRLNCEKCSMPYSPDLAMAEALDLTPTDLEGANLCRGEGCSTCSNTGYLGRIGVFEVLPMTRRLQDMGSRNTLESIIRDKARSDGIKSLRQKTLDLVFAGRTTPEEVLRVTQSDVRMAATYA
ncbi:MAG TPA: GspE/PulE family protein [Actinomycetota bacterium]|nr:GspE/PulE family protein [Actinomycetota bacterium]